MGQDTHSLGRATPSSSGELSSCVVNSSEDWAVARSHVRVRIVHACLRSGKPGKGPT